MNNIVIHATEAGDSRLHQDGGGCGQRVARGLDVALCTRQHTERIMKLEHTVYPGLGARSMKGVEI